MATIDPSQIDLPEEINSERLSIRAPHPDFAREMNEAVNESFEELRAWMEWAQTRPSLADSEAQARRARDSWLAREDLQLVLFEAGSQRIVGSSGLHNVDWAVPKFEIGYWVRTSAARRGYVTEAVGAIADFAFETLSARRVEIRADVRNARSRRVPERLGFELEGILRHDALHVDGKTIRDTAVYARVR